MSEPGAWAQLKQKGRAFAFTNPLYERGLRGPVPPAPRLIPPDPWPGRADRGQAMLGGAFTLFGRARALAGNPFDGRQLAAPIGWQAALHGFHWLRHLRAAGGDSARRLAADTIMNWLDTYPSWDATAWALPTTGARVAHWLSQFTFYEPALDDQRQALLMDALGRQIRHLMRNLPAENDPDTVGAGEIVALKGWVLGALCLDPDGLKLGQALTVISQRLAAQIAPDGGYITRNPLDQLGVVRDLIDIRAALVADGQVVPPAIQDAIDRTIPALRLFRHGDGGLATMNGALEADPLVIDTALAQADARGRPLRSLVETGYERVGIGRTSLIIDTAGAPPKPYDTNAHAGLFGFEMSHGRERIIVSCGHDPAGGALTDPLRSTAASSTLVVADTNASAVTDGGGIEREPARIASTRETGAYGTRIAMSHDGWLPRFGLTYDRIITVSESGEAVFGEDRLHGRAGHRFSVRFHIAPDIQVSPIQGGALLKPLSGTGWRFQAQGASLDVEESIYLGDGAPRRCYQLVLTGETEDHSASALKGDRKVGANLGWSLTRERKPAKVPTNHQALTL